MIQYFDPADGLIFVSASVRGFLRRAEAELALDTGATFTVLAKSLLARIGVDLTQPVRRMALEMGAGPLAVEMYLIEEFSALGRTRGPMRVVGLDWPAQSDLDGVLGLDFLAHRRLTLDFRRGSLELS